MSQLLDQLIEVLKAKVALAERMYELNHRKKASCTGTNQVGRDAYQKRMEYWLFAEWLYGSVRDKAVYTRQEAGPGAYKEIMREWVRVLEGPTWARNMSTTSPDKEALVKSLAAEIKFYLDAESAK